MAIGHGHDGRHLGDQPHDLVQPVLRVVDVLGFGINAGECGHRAHQHCHRMGVVAEALHELLDRRMQHGVVSDLIDPARELGLGGELAKKQEVRHLQESALRGQRFNGVTAIA